MKLITIVTEAYALDAVTRLLREVGAQGWTHFPVEGAGSRGERGGETPDFANVQIEVILQPDAAERLLARLSDEMFASYAMVAAESDVRVLRPGKF